MKSFSRASYPPPLRAMPVRTPAQLLIRSYVFPYLRCRRIEIRDVYFSEGVQKVKMGTLMLGGVHFFLCFPCSVALPFPTFATPLRPECYFCSSNQNWPSHARCRSYLFVLPVLGGGAIFNLFSPSTARVLLLLVELTQWTLWTLWTPLQTMQTAVALHK